MQTAADKDLYELLLRALTKAQEGYAQANEAFWKLSGDDPLRGLTTAEQIFRVENAAKQQNLARAVLLEATQSLNFFFTHGALPAGSHLVSSGDDARTNRPQRKASVERLVWLKVGESLIQMLD